MELDPELQRMLDELDEPAPPRAPAAARAPAPARVHDPDLERWYASMEKAAREFVDELFGEERAASSSRPAPAPAPAEGAPESPEESLSLSMSISLTPPPPPESPFASSLASPFVSPPATPDSDEDPEHFAFLLDTAMYNAEMEDYLLREAIEEAHAQMKKDEKSKQTTYNEDRYIQAYYLQKQHARLGILFGWPKRTLADFYENPEEVVDGIPLRYAHAGNGHFSKPFSVRDARDFKGAVQLLLVALAASHSREAESCFARLTASSDPSLESQLLALQPGEGQTISPTDFDMVKSSLDIILKEMADGSLVKEQWERVAELITGARAKAVLGAIKELRKQHVDRFRGLYDDVKEPFAESDSTANQLGVFTTFAEGQLKRDSAFPRPLDTDYRWYAPERVSAEEAARTWVYMSAEHTINPNLDGDAADTVRERLAVTMGRSSVLYCNEKYDGVRALWVGSAAVPYLRTKRGMCIRVPAWVMMHLPRGIDVDCEFTVAIKKDGKPDLASALEAIKSPAVAEECWRKETARLWAFDLPFLGGTLAAREAALERLFLARPRGCREYMNRVKFETVSSIDDLKKKLKAVVDAGGEGLVCKDPASLYERNPKSTRWLKVKSFQYALCAYLGQWKQSVTLLGICRRARFAPKCIRQAVTRQDTRVTQRLKNRPDRVGCLLLVRYLKREADDTLRDAFPVAVLEPEDEFLASDTFLNGGGISDESATLYLANAYARARARDPAPGRPGPAAAGGSALAQGLALARGL